MRLIAVAFVSAGVLAYEVLLARLLSIIEWYHFAYMVISIALLGYGASGTFLALVRARLAPHATAAFGVFAALFALGSSTGRIVFSFFGRIDPPLGEVLIVGTGPLGLETHRRLTEGDGTVEGRGHDGVIRQADEMVG